MKRAHLLAAIRIAAYHEDARRLTRLKLENRISWETFNAERATGRAAKAAGIPCTCSECSHHERLGIWHKSLDHCSTCSTPARDSP